MKIHTDYYLDEYKLMHHVHLPSHGSSENVTLFHAGYSALRALNIMPISYNKYMRAFRVGEGKFTTHLTSKVLRFSHDNMTGLYIYSMLCDREFMKELPIIKWKSKKEGEYDRDYWLHPRDIITYLIFHNNFFGYLMAPILLLMVIHTALRPQDETSGKCKFIYVFSTWKSRGNILQKLIGKIGFKTLHYFTQKAHGDKPFIDILGIYFKDTYHPLNVLIRRYYASVRHSTKD